MVGNLQYVPDTYCQRPHPARNQLPSKWLHLNKKRPGSRKVFFERLKNQCPGKGGFRHYCVEVNMGRYARSRTGLGVTHTIFRGVRKSPLFRTKGEYEGFLELLDTKCLRYGVVLFDYTLMNNHAHLIPKATGETLSNTMRDVLGTYARQFNGKYETKGHVLESRYKSIPIRQPAWLRRTSQYVQLNPVAAGQCNKPWEYPWSSASVYAGMAEGLQCLDTKPVLSTLNAPKGSEKQAYIQDMTRSLKFLSQRASVWNEVKRKADGYDPVFTRASLEHLLVLRETIASTVTNSIRGIGDSSKVGNLLLTHLARKWRIAPSWLVAIQIGTSSSHVRNLAAEARSLLLESPELQQALAAIESGCDERLCA